MHIAYRRRLILLLVWFPLAVMLAVSASPRSGRAETSSAEHIAKLVKQLGSEDYDGREAASKALAVLGEPARAALEKEAATNVDVEVRQRAKDLVGKLDAAWYRELRCCKGHTGEVISVAFSPDGKQALSGSVDGTLRRWDLTSGKQTSRFNVRKTSTSDVAFSPDGTQALFGATPFGVLALCDIKEGKDERDLHRWSIRDVHGVAFSPNAKDLLSGGADNTLTLRELATGKELRRFKGHKACVWRVAFSPDGKRALSGSMDTTMKLWDIETGKELLSIQAQTKSVLQVAFSPDGKHALSRGGEGSIRLWELETGRLIHTFQVKQPLGSMAMSPDGKRLLSGGFDGFLRLWDLKTGKELRSFSGHSNAVSSVCFSPDGKQALSGGADSSIRLWQVSPPGK